jgi:putative endonuclease
MVTSQQRMATGGYGEACAARYLAELGMVVLDRNWRCDIGELDLVLRDGQVLVFCEVKTRSSAAFGNPLEAVTPAKVARLRRLAARWVADHGVRVPEIRLDVVGVQLDRGVEHRVQHVRGVG